MGWAAGGGPALETLGSQRLVQSIRRRWTQQLLVGAGSPSMGKVTFPLYTQALQSEE